MFLPEKEKVPGDPGWKHIERERMSGAVVDNGDEASASAAEHHIDEGLYSRQLYVLGHEAMRRMKTSNVLIVGLKGLGIEIAKNVILAGVKSVTVFDPNPVTVDDLSAQFYLNEECIGQRRDEASLTQLSQLNEYVPVKVMACADLTALKEHLNEFQVVVVSELSWKDQLEINEFTHSTGRAFISADVRGLFAQVFCDFGEDFTVTDLTGEPVVTGLISAITREENSTVTCLEDMRHNLEDGDYVKFREIKGMTELNDGQARPIKVLSPFTFSIGDTSGLSPYLTGGAFEQVKQPKTLSFKSLSESFKEPEFVISDFAKMDRMAQLHLAFATLAQQPLSEWPRPRNPEDAQVFVGKVKTFAQEMPLNREIVEVDEKLITEFAMQSRGYLAPMCAVIGGMVAQEVLKACSAKFSPLRQHFYFDSLESLPINLSSDPADFAPRGNRYDAQIAVFGRDYQTKLENSRGFIVGSGAIGCELIKIYALMGVGCGVEEGQLYLTDMDTIEKSNLNRQFLFRPWDVSKPKSTTAAEAALRINPQVKLEARLDRVGAETEAIFNRKFYESLDFVTNALDNVEARKYVDQRCVFYGKPLLESGTLGTKGNTQVVIPHLTESYSSSQDPPEKTIPFCTLHNFPNTIDHTIQWAMDWFSGVFKGDPEAVNRFLQLNSENPGEIVPSEFLQQKDRLDAVRKNLFEDYAGNFEDCIRWARLRFQDLFHNNIEQLLFNFPKDSVTTSGTPFWSGPKRAPTPIVFNPENPLHVDFVMSGANLRAYIYGIEQSRDRELVKRVVASVPVPEFKPKSGVKIQTEGEPQQQQPASPASNESEIEELKEFLVSHVQSDQSVLAKAALHPHAFEKDDDSNFHLDFVTACANLRAVNYEINPTDRHNVKFIAGKIIPAIATTTAVVSGLVGLELYKVLDGPREAALASCFSGSEEGRGDFEKHWNLDRFKNGFVNLALPFFAFSSPILAPQVKLNTGKAFTLWDSVNLSVEQVPTLQALLDHFTSTFNLSISMLSSGSSLLYSAFLPKSSAPERKAMPLRELLVTVSKKELGAHVETVTLEALCDDAEGNDVEIPVIKLAL